jgi:hypothetical protein
MEESRNRAKNNNNQFQHSSGDRQWWFDGGVMQQ